MRTITEAQLLVQAAVFTPVGDFLNQMEATQRVTYSLILPFTQRLMSLMEEDSDPKFYDHNQEEHVIKVRQPFVLWLIPVVHK